jgi:hypothetical protein
MQWRIHVAGELDSPIQRCVDCGLVLTDANEPGLPLLPTFREDGTAGPLIVPTWPVGRPIRERANGRLETEHKDGRPIVLTDGPRCVDAPILDPPPLRLPRRTRARRTRLRSDG